MRGRIMNKYHAKRTYSELNSRWFSSKLEAGRADELKMLEMYGNISDLEFQKKFILSDKPKVTITVDFTYIDENGVRKYEDTKGMGETREFRVKRIWLKEKHGVDILLTK